MAVTWLGVVVGILAAGGGRATADFIFGEPTDLGPTVNRSTSQWDVCISGDGLLLLWGCSEGYGAQDMWMATRTTPNDPWSEASNLGPPINTPSRDTDPSLSSDGLTLFFSSNRPGGLGGEDLWVAQRAEKEGEWGTPVNLGPPVNSEWDEEKPSISGDGLSLYFSDYSWWAPTKSPRPGGQGGGDIWVTTRASKDAPWGSPVNLGRVNSSAFEGGPSISADGLALFFFSNRPGGLGDFDLWVATRHTQQDVWGEPVNLGSILNSGEGEADPCISADGSTLYYNTISSVWALCKSQVVSVVDFNGDGNVNGSEIYKMIDCWGTDDSFCDIGPMPWGDGVVDVKDLRVLAESIGAQVDDPTSVAHWALDETQGDTAYESVGGRDDIVVGSPVWQPASGKVKGALQLDGVDDFVASAWGFSPAEGPFSVLAWIKGGAPGQVVLSQAGGVNWLMASPADGALMTDLKSGGRKGKALVSTASITDGAWHRIGLVWDGSNRVLCVDGIEVARDRQSDLAGGAQNLAIGAGKALEPGSFWSGLIDDVRIYNRAVAP